MNSSTQHRLRDLLHQLSQSSPINGHKLAICVPTGNNDFLLYPDEHGSPFKRAVTFINPRVALKARTLSTETVLANTALAAREVRVNGDIYIPIVQSFEQLPGAAEFGCAALVREEAVLVVWSTSSNDALCIFETLEHRLRHVAQLCACNVFAQPPSPALRANPNGLGGLDSFLFANDDDEDDLYSLLSPSDWQAALTPLADLDQLQNIYPGTIPDIFSIDPLTDSTLDPWSLEYLLDNMIPTSHTSSETGAHISPIQHSSYLLSPYSYDDDSAPDLSYTLTSSSSNTTLPTPPITSTAVSPIIIADSSPTSFSSPVALSPMITISPTSVIAQCSAATTTCDLDEMDEDTDTDDNDNDIVSNYGGTQSTGYLSPVTSQASYYLSPYTALSPVPLSPAASSSGLSQVHSDDSGHGWAVPVSTRKPGRPKSSPAAAVPISPLRAIKPASISSPSSPSYQASRWSPSVETTAPGARPTDASASSSRLVGQKSKRSQYEDDSGQGDGDEDENGEADMQYDDAYDAYDDDDDDDDDCDDGDYVEEAAASSRPTKRARLSAPAPSTRPQKTKGRKRKASSPKKTRFSCPSCPETFGRKTDLRRHAAGAKCNGDPSVPKVVNKCDVCEKEFLRSDALTRHMRTVHKDLLQSP